MLGIGALSVFCLLFVPPIPHGPDFVAPYTVLEGFFYTGQPAKTAAYQVGCLATPFLLALAFWAARRWATLLSDEEVDHINQVGVVLYLVLMLSCAWPLIFCSHPPLRIMPPSWILLPMAYSHPFYQPERILFLLATMAAGFYFLSSPESRRKANQALVLLLMIWAVLAPSRCYLPSEIDDDPRYLYHLNSVLDAVSQSVNGHHLLINFPHIYGGYIEMLGPIIRLFPRSVGVLIAALAIPTIVGMFCLVLAARLAIRNSTILFICGLSLLSVCCVASSEDINYGFLTARFFFPPVGLLAAILYFRWPGAWRYALTTVIAVLASIWNLDTGIVLWGSWTGTLLLTALANRDLPSFVHHLLVQSISLAAAWAGFFLYLGLVSGQWPDVGLLFYFQDMVVTSGYFCLPMLFPDMWIFVLLIYLASLAIALYAMFRRSTATCIPIILMLSLFGIGFFSYFMGRSAPSNLLCVSYPAVLLAGILSAEGDILMREGSVPAYARFFLLPSRIALVWWAFLLVAGLPDFLHKSGHVVSNWNNAAPTALRDDATFVQQLVQPQEEGVYFLSNHSGIYYYLSGTVRSFKAPGAIELLRKRDMDVVINQIRNRRMTKLFVDQDFEEIQMYRPDIYQEIDEAIAQNYQEVKVGPSGRLAFYTPR